MVRSLPGTVPRRALRLRVLILAVIAALLILWVWGSAEPGDVVAASGPIATARGPRPDPAAGQKIGFARRDLSPVAQNLFESHSWYRSPPAPTAVEAPTAPPVPTAPPFPYSYLGKYERLGDKTVFFLVQGDRAFDVHVGDLLENTYSVDGIRNGQLQFTYLPLKIAQTLSIGDER